MNPITGIPLGAVYNYRFIDVDEENLTIYHYFDMNTSRYFLGHLS